jgi:hypothetical protein
MARELDFWEAWTYWAAGVPIGQYILWGQEILWWGRAGKIAEFLAGLTVLLDIIGPERLRAFARSGTVTARERLRQLRMLATLKAWGDFMFTMPLAASGLRGFDESTRIRLHEEQRERSEEVHERYKLSSGLEWFLSLLLTACAVVLIFSRSLSHRLFETVVNHPWLLVFGIVLIIPGFLFYLASLMRALVYAGLGVLILRPLAWLLDQPKPGYGLRWLCFFLFVIGFQFDLLAS